MPITSTECTVARRRISGDLLIRFDKIVLESVVFDRIVLESVLFDRIVLESVLFACEQVRGLGEDRPL